MFDRSVATGRTSNIVVALTTDAAGALVVLGGKDGVCSFDLKAPAFTCAPLPDHAEAFGLRRVGDETWIHSSSGVFVRSRDGQIERLNVLPADLPVRDVWREPDGTVGFVSRLRGIVLVAGGRAESHDVVDPVSPGDARLRRIVDLGGLAPDDVNGVTRAKDGTRWVATKRGAYTITNAGLARAAGSPDRNILFVAEDAAGNVYLSAFNDGLYVRRGDTFARIPLSESQPAERLDTLFEDADGNMWVGSRLSGLHRLRDGPFVPWGAPEGVTHGFVSAVLSKQDGTVLVGTGGGGVFIVRGDRVVHVGEKEGLATPEIDSLAEGRGGTVLVGTRHGLFRITSFEPPRAVRLLEAADVLVSGVYEDDRDLFVGTAKGLVAPKRNKTFTRADGLPEEWVGTIARTRDGTAWISTAGGLVRLRGERLERPFEKDLGATIVSSMKERADGSVLLGTSDAGLFLVRNDRVQRLHRGDGLYDDTVHAAIEGGDGRLWMSCNKGVYAVPMVAIDAFFAGRAPKVTSQAFGRADGMRSRECNGGVPAASRDPTGRIWFPTMLGAVAVDPKSFKPPLAPRAPVVETVRVKGAPVTLDAGGLELPPDGRAFDVTFTAPALVDPDKVQLEVRLTGAQADWHATTARAASFAALGPGAYVFEVRALNEAGVPSTPTSFVVRVPPRLVETTTFKALVALGVLALVVLFALLRVRSMERERRTLARLVDERRNSSRRATPSSVRRSRISNAPRPISYAPSAWPPWRRSCAASPTS